MPEPKDGRRRRTSRNRSALGAPQLHAEPAPAWGEAIRALYDGVVQEPLPADLLRLLRELGKSTGD